MVVTELPKMSLSARREYLARMHGRYQRAGRLHKTRILDGFCALCGYHHKAALRLLNRPLPVGPTKRTGPKIIYEPTEVLPVPKVIWLATDIFLRRIDGSVRVSGDRLRVASRRISFRSYVLLSRQSGRHPQ